MAFRHQDRKLCDRLLIVCLLLSRINDQKYEYQQNKDQDHNKRKSFGAARFLDQFSRFFGQCVGFFLCDVCEEKFR